MAHKETPSFDKVHGLYHRTVGINEKGRKRKFWLGDDEKAAVRRAERLELLWEEVKKDWQSLPDEYPDFLETKLLKKPDRPRWDEITLAVAKTVAEGGLSLPLPRSPKWSPYKYTLKITEMQRRFSVVSFMPEKSEAEFATTGQELYQMQAEADIREAQDKLALLVGRTSGQTWHQALDAYIAKLEKLPDESGWYRTQIKQTRRLKEHHPDIPLAQLNLDRVEEFIDFWRHRPVIKDKTVAATTARNEIIQLDMIWKWLDRSDQWNWQRPGGFEDLKRTVKERDEDDKHVETFTVEELAALWQYASPLVRLEMCLALNCGFKYAEIASLSLDEIHLGKDYPGIVRNDRPGKGDWIVRKRRKTKVYGEWKLWDVTVAGIAWARANRAVPATSLDDLLLVTKSGRAMDAKTAGGNKSDKIHSSWVNLSKTVQANHPGPVRFLSFKHLEKTATQWLRDHHGGEVANLFVSHGKPVKNDQQLEAHSNKPFGRLFRALDELRQHLAPVFSSVSEPWKKVRRIRKKAEPGTQAKA
jgi:hypothetical protein